MGEQSNAYRILLRYDRKSRHRRIKKRRRYERLAATSQFLSTHRAHCCPASRFSATQPVDVTPSRVGVARTLSRFPVKEPTNTLASVEPPSPCAPRGGRVWPGRLRIVSIRRVLSVRPGKGLLQGVTAAACYRRPRESSPHPGVSPAPAQALSRAGWTRRRSRCAAFLGLVGSTVNPCGNFSGTSSLKFRGSKGSIGHTFMVCIHTENQNQGDFYPFVLLEISVLHEPPLGHLRYGLTDVPPQPNSPPDNVFNPGRPAKDLKTRSWT